MKKLIALVLALSVLSLFGCQFSRPQNGQKPKGNYINEQVKSWEGGPTFKVVNVTEAEKYEGNYYNYIAKGKFIFVTIEIVNNGKNTFRSSAGDIWLIYNGEARIEQSDMTYYDNANWHNIEIVPTLQETHTAVFDVGKDVSIADLQVAIGDGALFNQQVAKINLTQRPTTD